MSTNPTTDHAPGATERKLRSLQTGLATVLAGGKQMPFRGGTMDLTSLNGIVAASLAPYEAVHVDRQTLTVDVAKRRSGEASAKQLIKDFQFAAATAFGEDSNEYQTLGFKPRKKATLTTEAQSLKVQRSLATRQARGTKGSRQKQSIRGVVNPSGNTTTTTTATGGTGGGSSPAPK
ncbi:MAG TPA: hypothetical protein VFF73_04655 [Planctomycetota bacterium]|nr:hypothetical protein [Planctomycetota bacterium]